MKIIASLTSPYVRKVRIVLAEKKIEAELLIENVWSEGTKISESNPLGKVPCLLLEDGSTIYDSRVIVEYVELGAPLNNKVKRGLIVK